MGRFFSLQPIADRSFSLQNRGNVYGDGSLYTPYRNVRLLLPHPPSPPTPFTLLSPSQNAILAVIGIPAAFLAGYLVELPRVGRKGTLALFSCT